MHFVGIEDREDLIAQARKYIIKDRLLKDMTAKENYLLRRVDDFKIIFKDVFEQGLPNFWDEQGLFLSSIEYQVNFLEKRNDLFDINQLTSGIKGQDIFDILEKDFYLLFMMRKLIMDSHLLHTPFTLSWMQSVERCWHYLFLPIPLGKGYYCRSQIYYLGLLIKGNEEVKRIFHTDGR